MPSASITALQFHDSEQQPFSTAYTGSSFDCPSISVTMGNVQVQLGHHDPAAWSAILASVQEAHRAAIRCKHERERPKPHRRHPLQSPGAA